MADDSSNGILIIILIAGFWIWSLYGDIKELKNNNLYLEDKLSSYKISLEEANSMIESAQSYAWSSYEEMGYALDNLYPISVSY